MPVIPGRPGYARGVEPRGHQSPPTCLSCDGLSVTVPGRCLVTGLELRVAPGD